MYFLKLCLEILLRIWNQSLSKNSKMSISAFIPVFNEEKRIRYALTSIQWCDEIIVLDKTSSDRTVEIAKEFGTKVLVMPNSESYNVDEFDYLVKYCTSEWVIIFTASDIMDVELAHEIKRLTSLNNFEYDIIEVPFKRYILGIEDKRSPWHGKFSSSVFRRSTLKIRKEEVHGALSFESNRKYTIQGLNHSAIHHLTHETVDSMMDRHLRYWRAEGANYTEPSMKKAFRGVLRALKHVFFRNTILLGWNGIALICAYLSYAMMSFVYKWEKKNNNATTIYQQIRESSIKNWKKCETNFHD